ncbi:hypothetical protein BBJ29_007685 [Phytophthora kernoviae]|uniref:Uncharacterized protein n=1 Tax=Phytophthora kernoviae TaxID=325452 RepID=A0A3F2RMI4_9STRA|nr:hypothetical protein BBP00_00005918 [Phytophthora kernoviae]RLN70366.1 hypothetical protein BBJ29_007685 [Phytophthora kernoviae]
MTYVSGGDVVAKRSPWRLTIMSDMFWGVVNFVGLLIRRRRLVATATFLKDRVLLDVVWEATEDRVDPWAE